MKTILQGCALAMMLALFSGCETTATSERDMPVMQRKRATFTASKEQVWPLLVAKVSVGHPIRVIEKDSGLITTDWVNMSAGFNNMYARHWVIPPGGFLATWAGLRMNMRILVAETAPGATTVTIHCHYEAFENNVQKAWVLADSNGAVESAILSAIEKQLANSPPPVPVVAAVSPAAGEKSPADALFELKKLLDAGAITPDEYAAKKKTLLDKL